MSDLHRLVYTSRNHLVGDEAEMSIAVLEILRTSQRNNARVGITGALLFNKGAFAQVLEGPSRAVEDTFERIQRDERHGDVTVLQCGTTAERKFTNWSMAFVGCSSRGQQQWNELAERSGFDASRMDGDAVFAMLHGLLMDEEGTPPAIQPASNGDRAMKPASALHAEQVRAELSDILPTIPMPSAAATPVRQRNHASSGPTIHATAPARDWPTIAVLRQALADERHRTTDLRIENDDLRISMAAGSDALLAMRRERDRWADRARQLAEMIGQQVEALRNDAASDFPQDTDPEQRIASARSAA